MSTNAPIVSWCTKNDLGEFEDAALADFSVVDAGSISNTYTYYLWNNREGSEDTYDMLQCRITLFNGALYQ
ncbi:hypothetical protein PQ478_08315 [Alkalihalophilus pseudofirmus]|uniref:hypothetical protein n=1 Tax=Alkalihalophilus pseudofirmus TaxID=79885 RepID=UPI00259B9A69|nr:hypothetical protein [Alkalihalophilus pseudofirmus]WEG18472.1 hypothetical protein PQ478_08315 [Alkalihalophilus pseudofirmus]